MPPLATHLNSCLLSERTLGASSPTVGPPFIYLPFFLSPLKWGVGRPGNPGVLSKQSSHQIPKLALQTQCYSWAVAVDYRAKWTACMKGVVFSDVACDHIWPTSGMLRLYCWEQGVYIVLCIQFQPSSGAHDATSVFQEPSEGSC